MGRFQGSWEEFFELFKAKNIIYGDWLEHVKGYWALCHNAHVHIIMYEDAVNDLKTTVENLAKFMGKELSQEAVHQIVQQAEFQNMKKQANKTLLPALHSTKLGASYFRYGTYGNWKAYFNSDQDKYIIENYDNKMKDIKLTMKC